MPTGYTCKVENGEITELKDYLLQCARGFGALIHMRDDSLDKKIELMEASDYHLKALNGAKDEYEEFLKATDEDIQKNIDESYERSLKDKQEGLIRFDEQKQRYINMLEKVKSWNIPTDEHKNLKEFAIKQLEDSIDFDCSDSLREYYTQIPDKDTVEGYKAWKLDSLLKDIERHSREYRKECERVAECNKWVEDLVNSL